MSSQNKSLILEVSILRPVTIVLLVLMHSFTVFNHSWRPFEGYIDIEAYKWITRVSFSFMMEMFVFILGYVLAYQIITLGRTYKWLDFVKRKFQRLIVPSIIFSLIYIFLLPNKTLVYSSLQGGVLAVVNGLGHMWFLPMLFWCFVLGFPLMTSKLNETLILLGLLCLSIVSWIIPSQLRLQMACYYLFFFYSGYYVYKRKDQIAKIRIELIILLSIIYVVSFLFTQLYLNEIVVVHEMPKLMKALILSIQYLCKIVYSGAGLFVIFSLILSYLDNKAFQMSKFLLFANSISFGVYIYQQFILQALYYHTPFPQIVGPYLLPWFGFIIALLMSVLLSWMTIKTKVGKFLIG